MSIALAAEQELRSSKPLDPCVMVIVGATGDLAARKLAPAIYNLGRLGQLPDNFAVFGVSRSRRSDEQFRQFFAEAVAKAVGADKLDRDVLGRLVSRTFYQPAVFAEPDTVKALGNRLEQEIRARSLAHNVLFYLATPAQEFEPIVASLGRHGLAPRQNGWARVIVEKPFGCDLASARELDRTLLSVFGEASTFRIDHYLGKETVQNLMVLRFSNAIFELMWNREHVDNVQITVAETLGAAGRAGFFEQTGILRDIAQNHLMQLLTLTAMEPPSSGSPDGARDEKIKVLRSLRRLTPADVVAGQYAAGVIDGRPVPGYRQEPGVAPDSAADTYLALRAYVDNWRWAGVPFYLRCGKRLARHVTLIDIEFKRPPLALFKDVGCGGDAQSNRLLIRIQPDEGIALLFGAKAPGPRLCIEPVQMDFRYTSSFREPLPDAYQRLLLDVMAGRADLFLRLDAVEEAWAYYQPILDAWAGGGKPLAFHPAGSWGPKEADNLMAAPDDHWRQP